MHIMQVWNMMEEAFARMRKIGITQLGKPRGGGFWIRMTQAQDYLEMICNARVLASPHSSREPSFARVSGFHYRAPS